MSLERYYLYSVRKIMDSDHQQFHNNAHQGMHIYFEVSVIILEGVPVRLCQLNELCGHFLTTPPDFCPSQSCPKKNLVSTDGIWLNLHTLIETSERKCSVKEPRLYLDSFLNYLLYGYLIMLVKGISSNYQRCLIESSQRYGKVPWDLWEKMHCQKET